MNYKGKITVAQMADGINALKHMVELLGKDNILYRHAVNGINTGMNTTIEEAFVNDWIFECFVAEAIIQNLIAGQYIDVTDVKNSFKHDTFRDIVLQHCEKYGIK